MTFYDQNTHDAITVATLEAFRTGVVKVDGNQVYRRNRKISEHHLYTLTRCRSNGQLDISVKADGAHRYLMRKNILWLWHMGETIPFGKRVIINDAWELASMRLEDNVFQLTEQQVLHVRRAFHHAQTKTLKQIWREELSEIPFITVYTALIGKSWACLNNVVPPVSKQQQMLAKEHWNKNKPKRVMRNKPVSKLTRPTSGAPKRPKAKSTKTTPPVANTKTVSPAAKQFAAWRKRYGKNLIKSSINTEILSTDALSEFDSW